MSGNSPYSRAARLAIAVNINAANTFRKTVNQTWRALAPNRLLPGDLADWDGHVALVVGRTERCRSAP